MMVLCVGGPKDGDLIDLADSQIWFEALVVDPTPVMHFVETLQMLLEHYCNQEQEPEV